MLCPRCALLIEQEDPVACPHCGVEMPEPEVGRLNPDLGEAPA